MGCEQSTEAHPAKHDKKPYDNQRHRNNADGPTKSNTPPRSTDEQTRPSSVTRPDPQPTPKTKPTEEKVLPAPAQTEIEWEDVSDNVSRVDVTEANAIKVVMGRKCHQIVDIRTGARKEAAAPEVEKDQLWEDDGFSLDVRLKDGEEVVWKRPHEFAENPSLFTDGTTRFDVGQGSVGTCWFLSVLSALADREELVSQIIVDDYHLGSADYKGVFHCRFWRLGKWEDVYIDDRLPIRKDSNRPWGSFSSTDNNEMWVSLMEKAFAKFYGSYVLVEGGNPGDAFTALTGGIADQIKHDAVAAKALYSRIMNALTSECIVACSVAKSMDKKKGLTGGHAYAVTGTSKVSLSGKRLLLIRVRNPWGTEKGEWTGDWSDHSDLWDKVSEKTRNQLKGEGKGDGEFWINVNDFLKYFQSTTICSFTPDFDLDGTQDNLDKTCIAFGEWKGETAAGWDFPEKYRNPRFMLTIPSHMVEADGTLPVVIQMTQQRLNKGKKTDLVAMRADLYRVEANFKKQKSIVLDEITNDNSFYVTENTCYRYSCRPGKYLILPNTHDPNIEKDFMIRVFAPEPLKIKHFEESPRLFLRREDIEDALKTSTEYKMEHYFGQWSGKNSGGQISNETFENNPQYAFTIADSTADVLISLKQNVAEKRDPIGMKLYKVDNGSRLPLPIAFLWANYTTSTVAPTQGDEFLVAYENANTFQLKPGTYCLVLFMDEPGAEKDYVLSVAYREESNVAVRGYNVKNDAIAR